MTDNVHPAINRASNDEAMVEGIENSIRPDAVGDDYTTVALRALAALDAHGNDHMDLMLQFGEAVAKAKGCLKHGEFTNWCREDLKRSPSWISAHRRLFEGRQDLQPALAWAAATGHRWASCYSVERLLKIVSDWKKATQGDSASAPRTRRKATDIIAELKQQLADTEADFIALRDPLTQEADARATELAARAANDVAAKEELAEIARRFHWRYRDFLHRDTCSAQQVSKPAPEVSAGAQPDAPKTDQPTSDEASAPRDQGNPPNSPHVSVAPATTPVDLGSAPLREEQRPQSQNGIGGTKLARTTLTMPPHFGKRADSRFSSKK
jgi:hypothetical protein